MIYLSPDADYFFEFQSRFNDVTYTFFVKFSPDEDDIHIALARVSTPLLWKNPFGQELKEFCFLFYRRFPDRQPYYICHIDYKHRDNLELTLIPVDEYGNLERFKTRVFQGRYYDNYYCIRSMESPYESEFISSIYPIIISPYESYRWSTYYNLKRFVESYSGHHRFS